MDEWTTTLQVDPAAADNTDEISRQATMTSEKCLLYVALTRAQKAAYITSYGTQSELFPK